MAPSTRRGEGRVVTAGETEGRGDRDSKGEYIKSGVDAFPYSLLAKDTVSDDDTPNQISNFSVTKMISEEGSKEMTASTWSWKISKL